MIGKMLGNRYEIVEQIGSGGMAYVYKAKCHLLDRFVAIKILKEEFTDDEDFIRKFRRESQAAASLSHPNILNIYDVGSEEQDNKKIHYIVMEYIKGKTLKELIVGNEKLQIDQSLYYATQIAEALSNAHKNHIVHRDIKPHNIMVTEDNRVKVTDFGIARAVTSSTITTTSSVLGSVHYFSPEQARGGYTDEKSDIYSLGIVMYEMITGKVPFNGDTPIGVALKHVQEDIVPPVDASSDIPREVNDIIMKCVMKRQGDRYQSADELLRDLKAYIDTRTIPENQTTEETSDMTRVIPVVSAERESSRSQTMDRSKKNKRNKNNKNKSVVIISAILAAFILATLIFAGYMRLRDNISTSDDILMPSLIGMTQEDAEVIAKDEGFQLNVVNSVSSTEYEAGRIISQNVDEGVRVKPGYPVSVTISLGSDRVTVPLLVNRTLTEAEAIIKEAGMRMNVEYDFSDTVPIDVVMEQSIESFTEVEPNTRIDLIVSKGEEISDVVMIQLIGTQISQAMNDIVGLDLVVGEVTYEPNNDVPANVVTWQSYDAGTTLETKTAVDMYVSSGPEPEPEPEPEPDPVEEPEPPSSDEESSFTFTLTPFTDREETEITIFRKQGGDATMVYSETHQADDGSFQVTVNGVPGAQFEVYYDGIYQFTRVKEG